MDPKTTRLLIWIGIAVAVFLVGRKYLPGLLGSSQPAASSGGGGSAGGFFPTTPGSVTGSGLTPTPVSQVAIEDASRNGPFVAAPSGFAGQGTAPTAQQVTDTLGAFAKSLPAGAVMVAPSPTARTSTTPTQVQDPKSGIFYDPTYGLYNTAILNAAPSAPAGATSFAAPTVANAGVAAAPAAGFGNVSGSVASYLKSFGYAV